VGALRRVGRPEELPCLTTSAARVPEQDLMPIKIFISYRRDDAKYPARMIHNTLEGVLPRENIFMDVDSIPLGADFVKILEGWVDECEILLALIDPGWITATDSRTGRRRIDDPTDFVRIEVREALARGILVVPLLLDGTTLPEATDLPADLKELVRRQAELIDFRTFNADVERLITKLGLRSETAQSKSPTSPASAIPPTLKEEFAAAVQHVLSGDIKYKCPAIKRFALWYHNSELTITSKGVVFVDPSNQLCSFLLTPPELKSASISRKFEYDISIVTKNNEVFEIGLDNEHHAPVWRAIQQLQN
jgi:hypothetical protein